MTPNDIEILIHCYLSPTLHPRRDAPEVKKALERMVRDELIVPVDHTPGLYRATARGAAHVAQLCALPLPRQQWIDAHGEVIAVG